MGRGQQAGDLCLEPVGVLVLVDQHVPGGAGELCAHSRVLAQHPGQQDQQIVEVHHLGLELARRIGCLHRLELGQVVDELRPVGGHQLGQGLAGVGGLRQHRGDGARTGEAPRLLLLAAHQLGPHQPHHVPGVRGVEHREALVQADGRGVAPQGVHREGVEGPAAHPHGGGTDEGRGTLEHLGGGTAREREQHDVPRVGALVHQPRHAMHEGACLAGAGTRHDEVRPEGSGHSRPLRIVQRAQVHGARLTAGPCPSRTESGRAAAGPVEAQSAPSRACRSKTANFQSLLPWLCTCR